MQRLHAYPDIRAMFRRLLIATLTGVLAALAVAVFRHAMYLLEVAFLSNDSGSLVNAAASLAPWRRAITPALGDWRRVCCCGAGNAIRASVRMPHRLYGGD